MDYAPKTPLTRQRANIWLAAATAVAFTTNTWLLMTGAYR